MSGVKRIRIFWLKLMYSLTIVIAGSLGAILLISPGSTQWIFGTVCPHILSGMIGSVFLAFALVSVLGLKNPVKFVPLLLMQLLYKSAWLCFVAFPPLITKTIAIEIIPVIAVFLAVVIGDVIAIPFHLLFQMSNHN